MRSVRDEFRPLVGLVLLSLSILVFGPGLASAQETAALTGIDETEEVETGSAYHPYVFAVGGAASAMMPVNILKEEIYDINDLTKTGLGLSAEVRLYIMDGLCLSVGGLRSGFSLVDNRDQAMADINSRFETDPINPDNFIRLDGLSVNLTAYFGNKIAPESRFNPYLKAGLLYMDWALESDGRGSDVVAYQDTPIEGTDFGGGLGIGTEYKLREKINLDLSLFWGYVLTGDDLKYEGLQSPENDSYFWTNTHFWNLSVGLVVGL